MLAPGCRGWRPAGSTTLVARLRAGRNPRTGEQLVARALPAFSGRADAAALPASAYGAAEVEAAP